jgi:predicted nucleic acid-binding protein
MARSNPDLSGYLDTNVLLRLALGDSPNQAERIKARIDTEECFGVSMYSLFEMMVVLEKVYKFSHDETLITTRAHLASPFLTFPALSFIEIALSIYELHNKLSIIDCVLLAEAQHENRTPLLTFDKDLQKAGGEFVVEP